MARPEKAFEALDPNLIFESKAPKTYEKISFRHVFRSKFGTIDGTTGPPGSYGLTTVFSSYNGICIQKLEKILNPKTALESLARAVLKEQPTDLPNFAAQHFRTLLLERSGKSIELRVYLRVAFRLWEGSLYRFSLFQQ